MLAILVLAGSCKKQDDYLNARRSNHDVTPSTLQDFQGILDGTNTMNTNYPSIGLVGTDNCYVTDVKLNTASEVERNAYIWAKDIFQGQDSYDWTYAYKIVEYSNIVLDGLKNIKITQDNSDEYNNVKGSALFYRTFAFYYLAQIFCKPYNSSTAQTDPGIPIRVSSDINIPSVRATVEQTYQQMITDLKTAIPLLPSTPLYKTRPCSAAANALLAKVYLVMANYTEAGKYANNALSENNSLLDYNSNLVNPNSTYRFPSFSTGNPEIVFYAYAINYTTITARSSGIGYVDTALYKMYSDNDLRKTTLYQNLGQGLIKFRASYSGSVYPFSGIANNEVYLIRAECYAREGNTSDALKDLNALLVKRWKTGTFIPYTASDSKEALKLILDERRKELPFTGEIRWADLRRLNADPAFALTITHSYNGTIYTMSPNDKRYVFPIPQSEVQVYGLPQNDR